MKFLSFDVAIHLTKGSPVTVVNARVILAHPGFW
jgi:hypothetical protein